MRMELSVNGIICGCWVGVQVRERFYSTRFIHYSCCVAVLFQTSWNPQQWINTGMRARVFGKTERVARTSCILDKCEWLWSSDEAHDVLALLSIISQCSQWSPYPAWAQSTVNHLELFQRTPTVSVQYDQFMVIDLLHIINLNYQRINMDYVMTSISYFTLMMSIKICWTWKPI